MMPTSLLSSASHHYACVGCFRRGDIWFSLIGLFSRDFLAVTRPSDVRTRSQGSTTRGVRTFATAASFSSFRTAENNHGSSHANTHGRPSSSRHPTHHARHELHPYPFPIHANPTPYEIFHLPIGAGKGEVKGRYYELVRLHHPDAPHCRALNLPPSVARARFQAITAAYEALKSGKASVSSSAGGFRPRARSDLHARAHGYGHAYAYSHARSFNAEWAGMGGAGMPREEPSGDDRWKDRMIIAVGIGALAITISPLFSLAVIPGSLAAHDNKHRSAAKNLAAARKEARTVRYGRERLQDSVLPDSEVCGDGGAK